jgi:hypothetical protein
MAMLPETPFNLAPRFVEPDRLLKTATRFIRMYAHYPRPVKTVRMVQHCRMIDRAHPKRGILPQSPGVKHPV